MKDSLKSESLDRKFEELVGPLTAFIKDYGDKPGQKIIRQFTLYRQRFNPRFFSLSHNKRYKAKKFVHRYMTSGKTPHSEPIEGIRWFGKQPDFGHPMGLAEQVYNIIDKIAEHYLEDPRVGAGLGIVIGEFAMYLFNVTALHDDDILPDPHDRANSVLENTKKWANSVIKYFQKSDPDYKRKLIECLNNRGLDNILSPERMLGSPDNDK